jgi:hypothetical protein
MPESHDVPRLGMQRSVTNWSDVDELRLEILRLRDELFGAEAALGEARARLRHATERRRLDAEVREMGDLEHVLELNDDLTLQLEQMRASTTWKLGRMIVRPLALLRGRSGGVGRTTER